MAYPDGYSLNYEYDAANRLTRISDANDSTIAAYEYDAAGRRTLRTLGNGTYATYEYDDLDRLILLVNYAPDHTVQSQFAYTYNAAGIRTSMTTLEGVHNYTYDNTYQLTGVSYPDGGTVNYDFDEVGNRKSTTDDGALTIYSTNSLDQYTQVGSEMFGYDLNGNLTTSTLDSSTTTYSWDEDDRLVSMDKDGIHIDYRYDYLGRLIAKILDGQQTRYIWDGLDLIAEMNLEGQIIKRHIYGTAINEVVLVISGGVNSWAQQDGLGSVVGATNDSGVVNSSCSYDVYGNMRSGDISPMPQRFTGMWWDEGAELYYVRARWYAPNIGKFISPDQNRSFEESNLYKYVRNRPTSGKDPLGLSYVGEILDRIGETFKHNWTGETISGGQRITQGNLGNPNILPVNWFDWWSRAHDIEYWMAEHYLPAWLQGVGILAVNLHVIVGVGSELYLRYYFGNDLIDLIDFRHY
jgi:RHS repeat-associated protein